MATLKNILLGSNKKATTGWSATTGRSYDITLDDYGAGGWSVACNLKRIGAHTIGWIVRADGEWGHVAGILAVTRAPEPHTEPHGEVHYVPGIIFPLPREWWIDGARLNLAGWTDRAPFGRSPNGTRMGRFRNGEDLASDFVLLILGCLHPVAKDWVESKRSGSI